MKQFLHKALVILSLIFSGALLISYLAPYISPAIFWPPAFFGLAYPYLLAINLLFVIYWIFRRRISFLIPLAAILIGYAPLGRFIRLGKNQPNEENKATHSVVSYNIRSFDRYNWTKDAQTPEKILNLITKLKSGIICFQEFRTTPKGLLSMKNLRATLGTPYSHSSTRNNGVATFSRFPILFRGEIPFNREHLCNCIYTDLKIGKDTLRVYNLHLESNRLVKRNYKFIKRKDHKGNEEDLEEIKDISLRLRHAFIRRADQVNIIRKHIAKSPYPTLICGDFNDTPSSYTYRTLRGNFKDAFEECGRGISATYIGDFPSFRIDFILYNSAIQFLEYKRIKEKFSDHYPVTGRFTMSRN